jgi:hypothetical protein
VADVVGDAASVGEPVGVGAALPDEVAVGLAVGLPGGDVTGAADGVGCACCWVACGWGGGDAAAGGDVSAWDAIGSGVDDAAVPIGAAWTIGSVIAQLAVPEVGWVGATVIVIVPEPTRSIATLAACRVWYVCGVPPPRRTVHEHGSVSPESDGGSTAEKSVSRALPRS